MKKVLLLACFLFVHVFMANAQSYSIILGRPTDKTITLSILFDQKVDLYIEYGTISGTYSKVSSNYTINANVPAEIELADLLVNTKYYYRIQYKSGSIVNYQYSPEYFFQTQRLPGSSFVFTVESD